MDSGLCCNLLPVSVTGRKMVEAILTAWKGVSPLPNLGHTPIGFGTIRTQPEPDAGTGPQRLTLATMAVWTLNRFESLRGCCLLAKSRWTTSPLK